MGFKEYWQLKERIVPELRFNQEIYEEVLGGLVSPATVWLDAGCGHQALPSWRDAAERTLLGRAHLVIGCDCDEGSVRRHRTLNRLVVSEVERLPFRAESLTLVTCNMVVEHLERPLAAFAEFARVLKQGGRVVVHTPNAYSPFALISRFIPRSLKAELVRKLDGRSEEDLFPTRYRANTASRLRRLMAQVGLREERCRLLASDAILAVAPRWIAAAELLYIRLTLKPIFKYLRISILSSFVKP